MRDTNYTISVSTHQRFGSLLLMFFFWAEEIVCCCCWLSFFAFWLTIAEKKYFLSLCCVIIKFVCVNKQEKIIWGKTSVKEKYNSLIDLEMPCKLRREHWGWKRKMLTCLSSDFNHTWTILTLIKLLLLVIKSEITIIWKLFSACHIIKTSVKF